MPSDTHTDEEKEKAISEFEMINRNISEAFYRELDKRERAAKLALIERLRTHGHGGGNWRRLLDEEAKKLEDTTKE